MPCNASVSSSSTAELLDTLRLIARWRGVAGACDKLQRNAVEPVTNAEAESIFPIGAPPGVIVHL